MVRYYIGTSGWHYKHWQGLFYPEGLSKSKWLEFYANHFDTVEINNSFYHLPLEAVFAAWHDASPSNFTFAVKVSRFITHIKRLKDSGELVAKFIARAAILGEKLGPLLYQLPTNMHRDPDRLESFLAILPRGMRHVFEFRHESWFDERIYEILQRYNIAFCVFDMPSFTCPLVATADFAYIRFHGSVGLYWSCYTDEELASWAGKLVNLAQKLKAIYIYFNNDAEAFAVKNAVTLRTSLETERPASHTPY